MEEQKTSPQTPRRKREIGPENFIFLAAFGGLFAYFFTVMGAANAINTIMSTAYALLMDTVWYLTAVCVLMGAISELLSEFGVVSLADHLLKPLMKPLYNLPGAASLGIVTTFLSDNPAILSLTDNTYFRHYFKKYQFPALTNLGTSFGMGLIVCTYMTSLSVITGVSYTGAVLIGLLGAVIGSVVSTRLMLALCAKEFGKEAPMEENYTGDDNEGTRPIRDGSVWNRLMGAILDGGATGVKMGLSIIPGVLIICTLVMMLTNGPSDAGYTGAAYEGVALLPALADKLSFILTPLFGFSSPQAIGVPITALGAAGAAISVAAQLVTGGFADMGDIAVFTAMCMCWSGYLSTHISMMNSLHCEKMISKALISHTIGGVCAGVAAHWLFVLVSLF